MQISPFIGKKFVILYTKVLLNRFKIEENNNQEEGYY